jgi:hypothetical protein
MKKNRIIVYCMVSFLIIASVMIMLKLNLSNFLPIVFLILFCPVVIYKWIHSVLVSSAHIKKYHIDFYNKYKSFTMGLDGNIVDFLSVSDKEIQELDDEKIFVFKKEIINNRNLIFVCFVSILFLSVLTVIFA